MFVLLIAILLNASASSAVGEDSTGVPPRPTPLEMTEALTPGNSQESSANPIGDPAAAAALPHRELSRAQAITLFESVFGEAIEVPAGIFGALNPDRYVSSNAAVLAPQEPIDVPGITAVGGANSDPYEGPAMVESTLPLRTEDENGQMGAVNLEIESTGGGLEPVNPLVEIEIPERLGEGIDVGASGISIEVPEAPADRTPSRVQEKVAFYPEVATDSSLVVAPTPTGVETFSLLQSPDAPTAQTFHLDLPDGSGLEATAEGGAMVLKDQRPVMAVLPPSAVDAAGREVPADLVVDGQDLILSVEPDSSTSWPVLVDPIYENYWWGEHNTGGLTDWSSYSTTPQYSVADHATCTAGVSAYQCAPILPSGWSGLYIAALTGEVAGGASAGWEYHVPRWKKDWESAGVPPTSFVAYGLMENVGFWHRSDASTDPTLWAGIWNYDAGGWVSGIGYGGSSPDINGGWFKFDAGQNTHGKSVGFSLGNVSGHRLSAMRDAYVGSGTVIVGDSDTPKFGSPFPFSAGWTKGSPGEVPISFKATDTGLGVRSLTVKSGSTVFGSGTLNCGPAINPCPRTVEATGSSALPVSYSGSQLPEGTNSLTVQAGDVVGNLSEIRTVQAKVDRRLPSVSLSGSLMEQATKGITRPEYGLKVTATDGTEASPQAGIAAVEIKVDNTTVNLDPKVWAPGCATQNCPFSNEWMLKSSLYGAGAHTVQVVVTDGAGNKSTPIVKQFQLLPDATKPTLTVSGSATEQATLGFTLPRYVVRAEAFDGTIAAPQSGVAKVEVKVDGALVSTAAAWSPGCATQNCSLANSWAMQNASFTTGAHTVQVTAEDASGNRSATWSQQVTIQRDTAGPEISLSGGLIEVPQGWVSDSTYPLSVRAIDKGYGVRQIQLRIDSALVGDAPAPECLSGGCERTKTFTLNTATYSGGSHAVEVTALDWAGNTMAKRWTMNVNPSGTVSAAEATHVMEAHDGTSGQNSVGPSRVEEVEGTASGLTLESDGGEAEAQGTEVPMSVELTPTGTIELLAAPPGPAPINGETVSEGGGSQGGESEGPGSLPESKEPTIVDAEPSYEPIEIIPTVVGGAATSPVVSGGDAAVGGNTVTGVDTSVKPLYDGAMVFKDIREPSAPETFSWEVVLNAGEEMRQINETNVGLYYADGTAAMSISAEQAHDAVGKAVPTSLKVAGNILTLTVHHKGGTVEGKPVVYPVVSGAGFEVGWESVSFYVPPPPLSPGEEGGEEGEAEIGFSNGTLHLVSFSMGPPLDVPMSAVPTSLKPTSKQPKARAFNFYQCTFKPAPGEPGGAADQTKGYIPGIPPQRIGQDAAKCHGTQIDSDGRRNVVRWAVASAGVYKYLPGESLWIANGPECFEWGDAAPHEVNCYSNYTIARGEYAHISIFGQFRFDPGGYYGGGTVPTCYQTEGTLGTRPPIQSNGTRYIHDSMHESVGPRIDGPCQWQALHRIS